MSAVAKGSRSDDASDRRPQTEKGTPDGGSSGNGSETTTGRKRESRAGTRKVTSLTPDQLSRKRANDREAQRTIRRRTKQHIEHLEQQVAALSAKGEHMDNVLQHNAALEAEIAHLRSQLSVANGRPLYAVNGKEQELPLLNFSMICDCPASVERQTGSRAPTADIFLPLT